MEPPREKKERPTSSLETWTGHTWGQLKRLAQDRDAWRTLVGGLCPRRGLIGVSK